MWSQQGIARVSFSRVVGGGETSEASLGINGDLTSDGCWHQPVVEAVLT